MQPSIPRMLERDGVTVPTFIYGTAWKEDRTRELTETALSAGFRGIDTANQRRHYHEAGVGQGVRNMVSQGRLNRSDLFLQTKFTIWNSARRRWRWSKMRGRVDREPAFDGRAPSAAFGIPYPI